MNVVCAWCTAAISGQGEQVSHGICVQCALHFLKRLPREYLSSIADEDGTVSLFSGHRLDIATGQAL